MLRCNNVECVTNGLKKKKIGLEEVQNECVELQNGDVTLRSVFGYCIRSQGKGFIPCSKMTAVIWELVYPGGELPHHY